MVGNFVGLLVIALGIVGSNQYHGSVLKFHSWNLGNCYCDLLSPSEMKTFLSLLLGLFPAKQLETPNRYICYLNGKRCSSWYERDPKDPMYKDHFDNKREAEIYCFMWAYSGYSKEFAYQYAPSMELGQQYDFSLGPLEQCVMEIRRE